MGINAGGGFVGNATSGDWSFGGLGGKQGSLGKYDVIGNALDSANPWLQQDKKNKSAADAAAQSRQAQMDATQPINQKLATSDTDYAKNVGDQTSAYLARTGAAANIYTGKLQGLSDQASSQASNAKQVYDSTILPKQKSDVDSAMSLKDYGNPNNKVMQGVRDLYNQQGQQARQQGQQDFGVLSALGAQAAQGQFGAAGPMTAGMQGQIYGQNQQQAGNAYAAAQNRMYDLQNQGLNQSFAQNDKVYGAGVDAQNRYENSQNNMLQQQQGLRGEQAGYAGEMFGTNAGYAADAYDKNNHMSDIQHNNAYAQGGRDLGMINSYYGGTNQDIANSLAASGANNASKGQLIGTVAGAAIGASDKRGKKNIGNVSDSDLEEFLGAVKPKTFDYKKPETSGTAGGKRIGFMLQDVQGTKLGDAMTRKDDQGKMYYDKDNLNGILLAALKKRAA